MSGIIAQQQQQSQERLRFLYQGKPLDVPADFVLKQHPGGKAVILPYVDRDIAEAFTGAAHSFDAQDMIEEYLAESSKTVSAAERTVLEERRRKREEENARWRWRSTAIAFTVAAIVGSYVLRPTHS